MHRVDMGASWAVVRPDAFARAGHHRVIHSLGTGCGKTGTYRKRAVFGGFRGQAPRATGHGNPSRDERALTLTAGIDANVGVVQADSQTSEQLCGADWRQPKPDEPNRRENAPVHDFEVRCSTASGA